MVEQFDTPSSVVYADLRTFGGISNKEAARILLSAKVAAGGKTPRDRIESRTYLSREVVHVLPTMVNPSIYGEFSSSTQTIYARLKSRVGKGLEGERMIAAHYGVDAVDSICGSLDAYGLDTQIYRNEVARLRSVRLRSEHDRGLLLLMLFCIAGCLANPREATIEVEKFARNMLAQDLATMTADAYRSREADGTPRGPVSLGLLRLIDGVAKPPIHRLNPKGSMVGMLADGFGAITDVDADVSRLHARIWHDGNRWLCTGLRSTNGTTIVSGDDGSITCVEPPRRSGDALEPYPPQELHERDIVCFGRTTQFLVLRVHEGDALS